MRMDITKVLLVKSSREILTIAACLSHNNKLLSKSKYQVSTEDKNNIFYEIDCNHINKISYMLPDIWLPKLR